MLGLQASVDASQECQHQGAQHVASALRLDSPIG